MPNDALSKIRNRAKKIVKSTGKKYQAALKQAGREYREGSKKISGARSNRPKKKSTGKSTSPSTRSHRVGAVRPQNFKATLKSAAHDVQAELGWKLAAQRTAATKKEKKGLQPQINLLTKQLKALKGQ